MKITTNMVPPELVKPVVKSFTLELTPREAVLIAALLGNMCGKDRQQIINKYVDSRCGRGILSNLGEAGVNAPCLSDESKEMDSFYFTVYDALRAQFKKL